jgi:hypothetical protein
MAHNVHLSPQTDKITPSSYNQTRMQSWLKYLCCVGNGFTAHKNISLAITASTENHNVSRNAQQFKDYQLCR